MNLTIWSVFLILLFDVFGGKKSSFFVFCLSWPRSDRCTNIEQVLLKVSSYEIYLDLALYVIIWVIISFCASRHLKERQELNLFLVFTSWWTAAVAKHNRGPKHKTQTTLPRPAPIPVFTDRWESPTHSHCNNCPTLFNDISIPRFVVCGVSL